MTRFDNLLARILALLSPDRLLKYEVQRCGEIIDPHLHIAPWFHSADPLVKELATANISLGLLYNPYPKMSLPFDMNTHVHSIAAQSNGRIYALASLNTTHDVWEDNREAEMDRLAQFLTKPEVLGVKLAPPHTCLPLASPPVDDVLEVVQQSSRARVVAIHIGTTPFCGPLGEQFHITTCCGRDYVDPEILIPKIKAYPDITFVLLHTGHEFLPPDSPYFYNFEFVDKSIAMAAEYPNVWISLSAMFAQNPDKSFKYPGGLENCKKIHNANVTHKLFWGSDASYFQGQIRPVLLESIKAMVRAGFSPEERCWVLQGATRKIFAIPTTPLGTNDEERQECAAPQTVME